MYWKYYDILMCVLKERNIFSLISSVRIPALWSYSKFLKFSSLPQALQRDNPSPSMRRVWAEKGEVLAHGPTSLLLLRIPNKQRQRLVIWWQLQLLAATCNLDSGSLDPFPTLQWKMWYPSCISHEACAKAPEDT